MIFMLADNSVVEMFVVMKFLFKNFSLDSDSYFCNSTPLRRRDTIASWAVLFSTSLSSVKFANVLYAYILCWHFVTKLVTCNSVFSQLAPVSLTKKSETPLPLPEKYVYYIQFFSPNILIFLSLYQGIQDFTAVCKMSIFYIMFFRF